jgi:hypothetical protein
VESQRGFGLMEIIILGALALLALSLVKIVSITFEGLE